MTQTVYKYPLRIADDQDIAMPEGAQLLTVQIQDGRPCLWALVDTANDLCQRKILIRGTGHDADCVGRYIGTFQMKDGMIVFHVFEL